MSRAPTTGRAYWQPGRRVAMALAAVAMVAGPVSVALATVQPATAGASSCTTGHGSGPWGWCGSASTGWLPGHEPDINGNKPVKIGFLSAGNIDDGGYYESGVDVLKSYAKKWGWKTVVLGSVNPSVGLQQAENVCREGVDLMIIETGTLSSAYDAAEAPACKDIPFFSSETTDSVSETPAKYFFYTTNQVQGELYAIGVATGIYLKDHHESTAAFVTGPQLAFTTQAAKGMYEGMHTILPKATLLSSFTGSMTSSGPAVVSAKAVISKGAKVVYPYLGGSVDAVAAVAQKDKVALITPGFNGCGKTSKYKYAISALFSPGLFVKFALTEFHSGKMRVGTHETFAAGKNSLPGVLFCPGTVNSSGKSALKAVLAKMASGKINTVKIVTGSKYNP
jgi:basic membrane protein A and related proteins